MTKNANRNSVQREAWVSPELRRLNAGDAESSNQLVADGGGGNQSS